VLHDLHAKTYFDRCKHRGLNYSECLKRVARRMSDIVYALLKSGRTYEPAIIGQAIEKRREQTARAENIRVTEALPIPDCPPLRRGSRNRN
jgi:hypothetical protein